MKCPFCAEEIKDEAIVCRYCGRDLTFFKVIAPILERLSSIENKVSEITHSLTELLSKQPQIEIPTPKMKVSPPFLLYTLAVFLPVLFLMISAWLLEKRMVQHNIAYILIQISLLISILSPLPFGVWLGLRLPGRHIKAYIFVGIATGLLAIIAISIAAGDFPKIEEWPLVFLLFAVAASLMYVSGGLIGDWIERKRSPDNATKGFAQELAKTLVGGGQKQLSKEAEVSRNTKVTRLTTIIQALAPILALIGSLITAYFGYLAAIAKKGAP